MVCSLIVRSKATSDTLRPEATRSSTLRRNSGGYPRRPTAPPQGSGGTKIQQSDSTEQGADHFQPPKDGSHGGTEEYPDEVRERAIRLVRDLVEGDEDGMSVTRACRRVGEQ